MTEYGYTVIYEALSEGGYQVIVPALPGIVTYGRNIEEAREMARDAIVCHLRGLLKTVKRFPEPLPQPTGHRVKSHGLGGMPPKFASLKPRVVIRALPQGGFHTRTVRLARPPQAPRQPGRVTFLHSALKDSEDVPKIRLPQSTAHRRTKVTV